MNVTIIGIGNIARGDDGVAHRVLELIGDARSEAAGRDALAGATLVAAHQLDFGMASQLADVDALVFVDAERRDAPPVEVRVVAPGPGVASLHGVDPTGLLGLAQSLYGAAPAAWLVSVAAPSMEHVEGLSATAEAASVEAASVIRALLAEHGGRLGSSVGQG